MSIGFCWIRVAAGRTLGTTNFRPKSTPENRQKWVDLKFARVKGGYMYRNWKGC